LKFGHVSTAGNRAWSAINGAPIFSYYERKIMKNKMAITAAGAVFLMVAIFLPSIISSKPMPADSAKAQTMSENIRGNSVAADNYAGVAKVPEAVAAKVEGDAAKGTVTAAGVGSKTVAFANDVSAAREKNGAPSVSAIHAEGAAETVAGRAGDDSHAEAGHAEIGHADAGAPPAGPTGFTGVIPLITPIPSGGGGGIPASRS
jgi:hypothetical protein